MVHGMRETEQVVDYVWIAEKLCVIRAQMSVQSECLVPAVPKWQDMAPGGKPAFQAERLAVIWTFSILFPALFSIDNEMSPCASSRGRHLR